MMTARSYLYVPGDRPDRFDRAWHSGADAVVLDLEDAVAAANKAAALGNVLEVLDRWDSDAEPWVRINQGHRGESELRALATHEALAGAFVPKASASVMWAIGQVLATHPRTDGSLLPICALVESAVGVQDLPILARDSTVGLIAMGEVDLAADLRMSPICADENLWPLRLSAVVASAAAGLEGPIGPVWTDIKDLGGFRNTVKMLRRNGFGAVQAIHPAQVPVINEEMMPSAGEYERANHLLSRATSGAAFADEKGQMIDEAVLRSARTTVAKYRSYHA